MNVLFCIGCDQYNFMAPLQGAEQDARAMFDTLSNRGYYANHRSVLLLSPSVAEMAKELATCLRGENVEIFTFFFAGHAGGKNGSFFIALRESETDALSTTAFPLSRLFEMVNEFQPRQVNVIIDGCEAGHSASSLHTLLRSENVGTVRASSISFLGACAAEQFAGESEEGGLLTNHVLRVLRGQSDLVIQKAIIELTDIASYVSEAVIKENPDQRPTWWGLNLFGQGGLAYNPTVHLNSPLPSLSLTTVDPASAMGKRLTQFSHELWDEYRMASKDFDPLRLNLLLRRLLSPADIETPDRVAAIAGLIGSFSSVAAADGELLAQHFCVGTCLVALLPWIDDPAVCAFVRQQLHIDCVRTSNMIVALLDELRANESRLLAHKGLLSDIYYLPLRITRLLGLIGMLALVTKLLNLETASSNVIHRQMVNALIKNHSAVLVALDDEQAAPLYIFLKAAQTMGWTTEAGEVVQSLYLDAAGNGGVFNRLDSGGEDALEHVLAISGSKLASKRRASANPSSLLPVILLGGIWFGCDKEWDLRAFDRKNIGLYFPDNFRDFSEEVISSGYTHTWHIGFGVWNTAELATQFFEILSSRENDGALAPEAHALCIIAAMLFPDRVPLNLESVAWPTPAGHIFD